MRYVAILTALLLAMLSAAALAKEIVLSSNPHSGNLTVVSTVNSSIVKSDYDVNLSTVDGEPTLEILLRSRSVADAVFTFLANGAIAATVAGETIPTKQSAYLYSEYAEQFMPHNSIRCLDMAGTLKLDSAWHLKRVSGMEAYAENMLEMTIQNAQQAISENDREMIQNSYRTVEQKTQYACKALVDALFARWHGLVFGEAKTVVYQDAPFSETIDAGQLFHTTIGKTIKTPQKVSLMAQNDQTMTLMSRQASEYFADVTLMNQRGAKLYVVQRQQVDFTFFKLIALPRSIAIYESLYLAAEDGNARFVNKSSAFEFSWQ